MVYSPVQSPVRSAVRGPSPTELQAVIDDSTTTVSNNDGEVVVSL